MGQKPDNEDVVEICPTCGQPYVLGLTGVDGGCDTCTGTIRDAKGIAWGPSDREVTFTIAGTGGQEVRVKRGQFSHKN
jgi:hypothetical protein